MAGHIEIKEIVALSDADGEHAIYIKGTGTAFGVSHDFSCHLWKYSSMWHIGHPSHSVIERSRSLYVSERWGGRDRRIPASHAFRKTIIPHIEGEANLWAMEHEEDFVRAEATAIDCAIRDAQAVIEKAQEEINKKQEEIAKLRGRKQ